IRRDQQSDRVEEVADVADDVLRAVGIAGDDDATGLAFEERWLVREDVVVDFIEPLDHALDFRGLTAQQIGVAKTTMSESSTFLRIPGQASPLPMSLQVPGKMSLSTSLMISQRMSSRFIRRATNSHNVCVLDNPERLSVPSSMVAFIAVLLCVVLLVRCSTKTRVISA